MATPRPLALRVVAPAEVRSGAVAALELVVTNSASDPLPQSFTGRPAHDFTVTRPDGTHVWRWSHDAVVQDILEQRTLGPGERLRLPGEWDLKDDGGAPVPAGVYLVRGLLRTDPPLATSPQPLRVRD